MIKKELVIHYVLGWSYVVTTGGHVYQLRVGVGGSLPEVGNAGPI